VRTIVGADIREARLAAFASRAQPDRQEGEMSLRKLVALGLVAAALVVAALLAAQARARSSSVVKLSTDQSEFAPGTLNNGWWDNTGFHLVGLDNYFAGNSVIRHRDFFTFDASLLPGCARSASLQVPISTFAPSPSTAGGLYVMHDVSTDPITLNTTGGPNVSIFDDLGSGAVYGSKFEPTAPPYAGDAFVIPLNTPAALHDLNAAAVTDSFFSIGGMIAGEPPETWLFGSTPVINPTTGLKRPVNLLVTVGPCGS
jgi:hypothetical protein